MEIKRRFCATRPEAIERLRRLCGATPDLVAVIPAAGLGARSGLAMPKQYHVIAGKSVLARSVMAMAAHPEVRAIVVVLSPDDESWIARGLEQELAHLDHVIAAPIGGATRRASVMEGCQLILDAFNGVNPWVMVHDAARPGLDRSSLDRLWSVVKRLPSASTDGAILAMPVSDTMKRAVGVSGPEALPKVEKTVDRASMWAAQTPQCFRVQPLMRAYAAHEHATDEAGAMEQAHASVALVPGNAMNFKLTTPDDFLLMEAVMMQSDGAMPFAVGQGFDVHALVSGRPLILGGVTIPYEKGLDGHSDADVLLHAITDAILGAACLGDIGRHFPDTDPAYRGADSKVLLTHAVQKVNDAGWHVAHVDATIIAQAPKISPYAAQMQSVIAACCSVGADSVNIKGKTTERLGFTGRGEGIAAQAVATLRRVKG